VRDGSPKGRDEGSVHDSPFPKGHAQAPGRMNRTRRPLYEDLPMGMTDDDDTVYCDIQMPVAKGRELLHLVNTLRHSKAYPSVDNVFEHMPYELSTSTDSVENPTSWDSWGPTHH